MFQRKRRFGAEIRRRVWEEQLTRKCICWNLASLFALLHLCVPGHLPTGLSQVPPGVSGWPALPVERRDGETRWDALRPALFVPGRVCLPRSFSNDSVHDVHKLTILSLSFDCFLRLDWQMTCSHEMTVAAAPSGLEYVIRLLHMCNLSTYA